MANSIIVKAGEDPSTYSRDVVGGKGLYLLKLHQVAKNTGLFNVPNFFIIPTNAEKIFRNDDSGTKVVYKSEEIKSAFEQLRKPVAVRSSSPLEDGVKASFAGIFTTLLDQQDYEHMTRAANSIYESAVEDYVQRYAERMGIEISGAMAIIIQEQVTNFWERGVIQLEEDKAIIEETDRKGRESEHEAEYSFLDELFPEGTKYRLNKLKSHDFIDESEFYYGPYCAREAKKMLGLEGVVQVEFFLSPSKLPDFVQIRQLPKVKSYFAHLDLDVPEGVPYIEGEVCNDVAGDLTLPVYATTSHSSLSRILIETGQYEGMEERAEIFNEKSALARNRDFQLFRYLSLNERFMGVNAVLPSYSKAWQEGNDLFDNYILVCDRLDETLVAMSDVTINKRAIITCLEAKKTSHAMTVARDLGIICMGVEGNLHDLEPEFFHKVETGDMVRIKSDGRRAVAYIVKKRESDPYEKSIQENT